RDHARRDPGLTQIGPAATEGAPGRSSSVEDGLEVRLIALALGQAHLPAIQPGLQHGVFLRRETVRPVAQAGVLLADAVQLAEGPAGVVVGEVAGRGGRADALLHPGFPRADVVLVHAATAAVHRAGRGRDPDAAVVVVTLHRAGAPVALGVVVAGLGVGDPDAVGVAVAVDGARHPMAVQVVGAIGRAGDPAPALVVITAGVAGHPATRMVVVAVRRAVDPGAVTVIVAAGHAGGRRI